MGKTRQRYQAAQQPPPEHITVRRPADATNKCLRALKSVIENSNLGFEEEPAAGSRIIAHLRGDGVTKTVDKYTHYILPLFPSPSEPFWIGVRITFKPKLTEYQVLAVSLGLFSGSWTEERKRGLFRAEWDCSGETPSSDHAQPHWQVYEDQKDREPLNEEEDGESVTEGFGARTEELNQPLTASLKDPIRSKSQGPAIGKFHFAMASGWQDGKAGSHQVELRDIESLARWLSGCISYTKRQLVYVSKKSPGSQG